MRAILLLLFLEIITAEDFHLEERATWAAAGDICRHQGYSLLPGRSYRKSDLVKTLTDGQTVWVRGWRMVTDQEPDAKGRVRFLKVEFIPNYTFATRYYICKDDGGSISVSPENPTTQPDAESGCNQNGQTLAAIGSADDITRVLDAIGYGNSHWAGPIRSRGRFAKQCLTARRRGRRVVYAYDNCSLQYSFICLQDAFSPARLVPIVVRKAMAFKDIEEEIKKVALMPISTTSALRSRVVPTSMPASSVSLLEMHSKTSSMYLQPTLVTTIQSSLTSMSSSTSVNSHMQKVNNSNEYSIRVSVDSSAFTKLRRTSTYADDKNTDLIMKPTEEYPTIQPTSSAILATQYPITADSSHITSSSNISSDASVHIVVTYSPNEEASTSGSRTHVYSDVTVHPSSSQITTSATEVVSTSSAVNAKTDTSAGGVVKSYNIQTPSYKSVSAAITTSTPEQRTQSKPVKTTAIIKPEQTIVEDPITTSSAVTPIVSQGYLVSNMYTKQTDDNFKTISSSLLSDMSASSENIVGTKSQVVKGNADVTTIHSPSHGDISTYSFSTTSELRMDVDTLFPSPSSESFGKHTPSRNIPGTSSALLAISKMSSVTPEYTTAFVTSSSTLDIETETMYNSITPSVSHIIPTPPIVLNSSQLAFQSDKTFQVSSITPSKSVNNDYADESKYEMHTVEVSSPVVSGADAGVTTDPNKTAPYSRTIIQPSVRKPTVHYTTTMTTGEVVNVTKYVTSPSMLQPTSSVTFTPPYPSTSRNDLPPTTDRDGSFKVQKSGREAAGGLVWIVLVIIVVAVTAAFLVAFVLHRRRQKQLKLPMNGAGPSVDGGAVNNNASKSHAAADDISPTLIEEQNIETAQGTESCL